MDIIEVMTENENEREKMISICSGEKIVKMSTILLSCMSNCFLDGIGKFEGADDTVDERSLEKF